VIRLLFVLVLAWAAAAGWLFVAHHDDGPIDADAVVVLAGTAERLPVAQDLMRRRYAPILVVSLSHPISHQQAAACAGGHRYRVICFRANPFSTHGEAEEIGRLARAHDWTRLDVVTSQFHIFRARLLVRRCYHGALSMVGAPQSTPHLPIDVVKETVKLVYQETVQRGC
jgi:uncharacterized SAM-binding protein YcdF (DUF218 family)